MVIILVGMSSMKSFYKKNKTKNKKRGQAKRNGLARSPFFSAPFCQGDLMYPLHIGPDCAEFSKHLDAESSL